jgi:hypothetical protein
MENLIPLLIGVIYLIYRQYQKSVKKAQPQHITELIENGTTEKQNDEMDFNQILKSIMSANMPFEEPVKTKIVPKEIVKSEKFNKPEDETLAVPYSVEYQPVNSLKSNQNSQFEMIQNSKAYSIEPIDFELRRAVILDAILNPPYINNNLGVKLS